MKYSIDALPVLAITAISHKPLAMDIVTDINLYRSDHTVNFLLYFQWPGSDMEKIPDPATHI